MIRLEKIRREFGGRSLLRDLEWQIVPGSRVGLIGANGSGKTTLLRIVAGQDTPDGGVVHRPATLRVGYLPQEVVSIEQGSALSIVLAGAPEVARIEAELERVGRRLAELGGDDAEVGPLTERYGTLRARIEQLDGDRLEARAQSILSGLRIPAAQQRNEIETFSGGWRMRVVLARLLIADPEVLLLDEPTNHLDLEAVAWLEEYLASFAGSMVVVSHDRYFLNRMVREIVLLERGTVESYPGNYDAYVEGRSARAEALLKKARQQKRDLAKTERFIERFRYKNTKARQVQSRIRSLEKVDRITIDSDAKRVRFGFPAAPRSGDVALRAERLGKKFGDHVVLDGVELLLRRGDRVALVGPNGAGKSTLLKLIAGRLDPDAGTLELGHNVMLHYYAQHQLDELDPEATVLEEMERVARPDERARMRHLLGCFLFGGDDVDKRVGILSGGEKARLALARLLVRPANLLLLDEPTNHLDLPSREVLEQALGEFGGTVVLVSHDRYFINRVVTSIAHVHDRTVERHLGSYDDFAARGAEAAAGCGAEPAGPRAPSPRRDDRRREAEERNRRYRERRAAAERLAPIEDEIERSEARLRELEKAQSDPEVYADPARAAEVGREFADCRRRLDILYEQWERLAEGSASG